MDGEACSGARWGGRPGKRRFRDSLRVRGRPGLLRQGMLALIVLLVASCWSANPPAAHHAPKPGKSGSLQQRGLRSTEPQQSAGSWRTFGYDPAAGEDNQAEAAITPATVGHLRRGWSVTLPDLADERPILVRGIAWPDGTRRDVLYLTTDKGTLLALDAATGSQLWAVTPKNTNPKYTKASPAADPLHGLIYSYGLDGKVHRFRATTGQEMLGNSWPVTVTRMPLREKVSAALNLANGYLYVTTASFSGDAPPYQGHLVAINVKTGARHVFNSLCNDHTHLLAQGECSANGGGIWGRPGVVVDPLTGHIFFAVSDGFFTANQGGADWGGSVIEMTADGAKVLDSYTPQNYATEAFQNRDIGSVAPTLLPLIPQSHTPALAVQAGKEGLLRLLNRQNLSGQGGPAHVEGITTLHLAWSAAAEATSPILAGGVLYAATSRALLALDPHTGHLLWSSALRTAGGGISAIHWESPIVVGGRLYCTDEQQQLTMYTLPA